MELFKLFGTIAINNSGANGAIDETTGKAEKSESKISSAFKKIGTAVVSFMAVDKIKAFGQVCVNMASDVQEMQNKFDVVFQGMTDEVEAWASAYASAIGRNSNTIKGYLADNQNMFVGMGMTREAAAGLSENLVTLALDLASFNNLQETDAVNALSKALMGESESAKTLGAVLNENTLAMAMNEMGIKKKFDALSEAEKMEVRYQAILMQSTDAVGDCERSLDSYKGRQIQTQSATENLKETIGTRLLPYMTILQEKFGSLVGTLSEYVNPAFDKIEEIASDISSFWNESLSPAISDVGDAFGAVWDALQPVIQSFTDLLPEMDSNKSAMDLVKEAADGIIEALEWLSEKLQAVATWISEHQTEVEIMATIIGSVAAAILLVNAAVTAWNVVAGIATGVTTALGAAVAFLTSPIGLVIVIITALIAIGVALYKNWDTIKEKCSDFAKSVKEKFIDLKEKVVEVFGKLKDKVHEIFVDGIWGSIKSAVNWILGGIESMCNGVIKAVNVILGGLDKVVSGVGDLIGLDWNVPMLSEVSLPRLEKGGVLEKGQVGLLEGNGAEAVVPLEQNKKWISKVSEEMQVQGIGGSDESIALLNKIASLLEAIVDNMPEDIREAIEKGLKLNINNREFARLVKAVN